MALVGSSPIFASDKPESVAFSAACPIDPGNQELIAWNAFVSSGNEFAKNLAACKKDLAHLRTLHAKWKRLMDRLGLPEAWR